jgi:precorrin-2 dehydrogenase/sirohydrochlorin ferrochelatase
VILNLTGRLVVVVGGGSVATRRVESLHGQGATVRVVAPSVTAQIEDLARSRACEIIRREFAESDVAGAFLVHAATNSQTVNEAVARAAEAAGALVCRADAPTEGSFITPSTVARGKLLLSISTGGESPTFASVLRDRVEKQYGPEYDLWIQLFGRLRNTIQGMEGIARRKAWVNRIMETHEIRSLIAAGKLNEAEEAARLCV